jgi:hypothetical protein
MFGSEEELLKPIPRAMVINLVGANHLHDTIISNCFELSEGPYVGRLKISSLLNTDSLEYKKKVEQVEPTLGLLNMNWIRKTTTIRPATILLVYDIRSKAEGITWRDYETAIYQDIMKAKKSDNYPFVNVIVIIYSNNSFNFDHVNEDRERNYSIKKILESKSLYYVTSNDGFKNMSRKFTDHVIKITVNYYKTAKKNLKIKKNNAGDNKEKLVKYNIKLGILALMKNKRRTWKYLEEGYFILANIDPKYFYYSSYVRNNYLEIKSVADWLIYKITGIKQLDGVNMSTIISIFANHIQNFSKINIFDSNEPMIIVEYFWRISRYQYLSKLIEEQYKIEHSLKNIKIFPGYYYMVNDNYYYNFIYYLDECY